MKKITTILALTILALFGYGQVDTVFFDLKESSMRAQKCNKLILEKWNFSISYSTSKFTDQDSSVFLNMDTIYLKVFNGSQLKYECLKLPEWHPIGWVSYYRKDNTLKKKHFWSRELSASNGTETFSESNGDTGMISKRIWYKKGVPKKKSEKVINFDSHLGFYSTYITYKYRNGKISSFKSKNYIYNRT